MAKPNKQLLPIRYVIYDKDTKRPVSQGTCLRKEFKNVVKNLENSQQRAKILKGEVGDDLDLTPYDEFIENPPVFTDDLARVNFRNAMMDRTADDAIKSIDDLDTE